MIRQNIIYILAFNLVFSFGYSQIGKLKKANKEYSKLAYVKTSEILLEVANKGYTSVDLLQKLANSFYFNNQMEDAVKWYGELMNMDENQDSEYYFRYALALRSIGNYQDSDKWMKKFHDLKPNDLRGKAFISEVDYKSTIEDFSRDNLEPVNLDFNTPLSDFGTTEYNNTIVFASARGGGVNYKWNEEPFLDLYTIEKVSDSSFGNTKKINGKVNTKFHESSAAYSPNGVFMYFTRNNYYKSKYKADDNGTNRLKLFRAKLSANGEWSDIHSIHFNSDNYSVAHPSISLDGKTLYFASDMPGTIGASDIFFVDVNEDGTLGTPRNLGNSINTEAQESFPFVNTNGDLYFASNGFPGLGGLDVFCSKELDQKVKSGLNDFKIRNVGKPVNSKADDFAFYENLTTKKVYFSSNREGGKGSDDIYSFFNTECHQMVTVKVRNIDTKELIPFSEVTIFDKNGNELKRQTLGEDATFKFNLACDTEYLVRGMKDNYSFDEKRFTTPISNQDLQIVLSLNKNNTEIEPCDDLAKILNIPIIYFDFDKYNVRYDAEVELQKILAVLNKYPTMTIDIRSHTDCRGTSVYNENLSDNRAQATKQYLIDKGISSSRLTAKGYGEYRLVNDCGCEPSNHSSCSEVEHQKNRRSEFIITSIKGKTCDE